MNKLAFSTLACPEWPLDRILASAREWGYDALELRGLQEQIDLPLAEPFLPQNRQAARRQFEEAGIAVCCVSSSGIVGEANLDHVRANVELARDLGSPLVRVFGGKLTEGIERHAAIQQAAQTLRSFGDAAQDAGVALVLETHDSFSTGSQVAELLEVANHPAVFSLWDLHHPYRQGEPLEKTYQLLKPTLRHVHVKDGVEGGYRLMGEGDIPLGPMLKLIVQGGYSGAISVEWEKRWCPEIADPEIALPQYARALRSYLSQQ